MQEFTTSIKGLGKGLRPLGVQRNGGMLADCLNMMPQATDKLKQFKGILPVVFLAEEVIPDPDDPTQYTADSYCTGE